MAKVQQAALARNNRGLMILALLAGLLAAVVVFVAISESGGDDGGGTITAPTTVKAVVAARTIPAGKEITAEMVQVVEVPEALLVSGAYSDSQLIVGQITNTALARGEQITPAKIGTPVEGKGLPVPPGHRGIAIAVREVTAVGGLLLPGNRVDIVAAIREKEGADTDREFLRVVTFLHDVEVLAVAQEAQELAPKPKEGASTEEGPTQVSSGIIPEDPDTQPNAGSVTVALDPGQVQLLVAMQEIADNVWLSLRPFGEEGSPDLEPVIIPILR